MGSLYLPAVVALTFLLASCVGPASTASANPTATSTQGPAQTTPTPELATTGPTSPDPTPGVTPSGSPPEVSFPPSLPPTPPGWRELTQQSDGPSAREDHTWTANADGTVAYLFGGRGPDGSSNELWAFDLSADSWSLIQPGADPPPTRFGHTATWVPDFGLVVWSGQGDSGFFDDIWAYDPGASKWTQLDSLGAVPAARYGSCASLGPDGELWISHGFTEDSGRFSDTRSYDFETGTWTDRTPVDRVPVERCLHDCFWSSNDQLVLYGGQTTGVSALGDVWAYDLATGVWTRGADPEAPARQLYALGVATEGRPRTAVVFGGGSLDGGFLNDAWLLDAQNLTLRPFEFDAAPPGRSAATLVDDVERARLLLFGGKDASGVLGDLWEFSF